MKTIRTFFTSEQIIFILLFTVLGLIALQVPLTQLVGSKVKFTLYDVFAPIAPAFIGTIPGIIAVFLMQLVNFFIHGAQVVDTGTLIRFFPMLFAALYFGQKSHWNIIVPFVAIIAFVIHPVGRTVWYFALYWTIPMIAYVFRDRWVLARSLGATFSAHAVGGALWIYAFNIPAKAWISLIPIVAIERIVFGVGIALMYVVINNVLSFLAKKQWLTLPLVIDRRVVFGFAMS